MQRHGERGFVLVVVLGVLVLMTVLALGFARRALLERRAAALSMEHAIAMANARGAAQRGVADLRNRTVLEGLGKPNSRGGPPTWKEHADPVSDELFDKEEVGENDTVNYVIEDLDGHISMNLSPEEVLDKAKFLGVGVISKIVDRRGDGRGSNPPTPFLVTEEIMTLDNLDDEDWYGEDGKPGLRDLVSAWGDNRININTASEEVLNAVPSLGRGVINDIVSRRRGPDGKLNTDDDLYFTSFSELSEQCDVGGSDITTLIRYCKLNSRFFTITGVATRMQGKVRAFCEATVEVRGDKAIVLQWREGPIGS
ncbi:MAG: type II secretion system protein GspK [FCB group bacterium]|jgi:hypothetical protein|nr:type II secretion system protein GspK [FCB group bacterium]